MLKPIQTTILATLALGLPFSAVAAESASTMKDSYDKIWGYATLYSNKENTFLQKLAFTGRLQYDYAYVDEDDAGYWDDFAWRRARAGLKATVLKNFTVHVEADLNVEYLDEFYNKLTDAYIGWSTSKDWALKFGKQSAGFTLDGATSSKSLVTAERSKLTENLWFTTEYFTGVTFSGDKDNWTYNVGIFSNDNGDEFEGAGDAKYFILASLGYDFGSSLNVDRAAVRLDYVHNKQSDNLGTKSLSDVASLNGQYDNGSFHLWGDLAYGKAFNDNEIWGLEIMPFYDINETFQAVVQYTYLSSSDNNGLGIGRYERELINAKGDRLQVFYVGLNTYFYGHKLKWQNGIQFTEMDDAANDGGQYSGLGFTSAIRLSW